MFVNNPDIDECVNFNGGCEHVCKNSIGSYECFCYNGHLLEADEHGCKGKIYCDKTILAMQYATVWM